jgi:FkbM family methyltransferase
MKNLLKKVVRYFGYELRRKRTKNIQMDLPIPKELKFTKMFSLPQSNELIDGNVGPTTELGNSLIIQPSSFDDKEFTIDAIHQMDGKWGFVQCRVEDSRFLMFLGGRDDGVALKFLHNGCYEKKTMHLWMQVASNSRMILDIGAHTGSYTISAKLSNTNATVLSFEPHYLNYARLSLNLRANGLDTHNAYMFAISDSNMNKMFSVPRGVDYHSSGGYVGIGDDRENYYVTCLALDTFIDERFFRDVDLIKIDTEGHELNCLIGMKNIISVNFPTIFFECISRANDKLEKLLIGFGYELFLVNDSTGEICRVNTVSPKFDSKGNLMMSSINRIAVHPSRNLELH